MAEIRPIQPWRYNPQLAKDIHNLTSPLFDVVSERQRQKLYSEPLNSIHLSVPSGENPIENAKSTLSEWKENGTLLQDRLPAIYCYTQEFSIPGSDKTYQRKGIICNIRIYEWDENVLLRHENTMPHSVSDREKLLRKTQLNVSPTHGLYSDTQHEIESFIDESMKNPIHEVEDYQGVIDRLSIIHDKKVIDRIISIIKDKQIILADGHHRYEGSLAHMKSKRDSNPDHSGEEGYNFHLMYLTNTEAEDLRILPTHRVISSSFDVGEKDLLQRLEEDFLIKTVENPQDIHEIILGKKWAFGLLVGDNAYKIRLKPEKINTIPWKFPDAINQLDLTVMHYFIFEKVMGIPGRKQRESQLIGFQRSFTECVKQVIKKEASFAIITKDIPIETVKEVCYSGYTMPQKSTYFYPKVICGFLFNSIQENEFNTGLNTSFEFPKA